MRAYLDEPLPYPPDRRAEASQAYRTAYLRIYASLLPTRASQQRAIGNKGQHVTHIMDSQ